MGGRFERYGTMTSIPDWDFVCFCEYINSFYVDSTVENITRVFL